MFALGGGQVEIFYSRTGLIYHVSEVSKGLESLNTLRLKLDLTPFTWESNGQQNRSSSPGVVRGTKSRMY